MFQGSASPLEGKLIVLQVFIENMVNVRYEMEGFV
jgi:hypothetical protein